MAGALRPRRIGDPRHGSREPSVTAAAPLPVQDAATSPGA
ncbi:DUF1937 domain-containing protein, partial [Cereibacter sphaeroides]